MIQFIVRFLVARLTPADLMRLGNQLYTAGRTAEDRRMSLATALAKINEAVGALAEK